VYFVVHKIIILTDETHFDRHDGTNWE